MIGQLTDAVDAVGRVTEFGVVGILLSIMVLMTVAVILTIRFIVFRIFDPVNGLYILLVEAAKSHTIAMERLPPTISENTQATAKIDSHVAKISAKMEINAKQMDKFRAVWRRHILILSHIAEGVGKTDEVKSHLESIAKLLDGDDAT